MIGSALLTFPYALGVIRTDFSASFVSCCLLLQPLRCFCFVDFLETEQRMNRSHNAEPWTAMGSICAAPLLTHSKRTLVSIASKVIWVMLMFSHQGFIGTRCC